METINKKTIAKSVSKLLEPPLLTLILIILVSSFLYDNFHYAEFIISVFFMSVVPVATILVWSQLIKEEKMDIPNKEDRIIPYVLIVLSYLICTLVLFEVGDGIHQPLLFISLSYFIGTSILALINILWKVSVHTAGVGIFSSIAICTFGMAGMITILLIPIAIWDRLYLKKHSAPQLICGCIIGYLVPICLYLLI